jgi:hypothetical protein
LLGRYTMFAHIDLTVVLLDAYRPGKLAGVAAEFEDCVSILLKMDTLGIEHVRN